MALIEPGSWIWIQNEVSFLLFLRFELTIMNSKVDRYLPAQVLNGFRRGEPALVRDEEGEVHCVV